MPIPIALFAFNRPKHLMRTLSSLAANDLAPFSPLIILCDGPRSDTEKRKTDAVRCVAHAATGFASLHVVEREHNMGLAASIIAGVSSIVAEYGRVIVLEDDLITSPYFLRYMNDGLNIYADNPKVASIHGYMYPHTTEPQNDTFFLRGADCLGWGTWRRAWATFNGDALDLLKTMQQAQEVEAFNRHGAYDYTGMLQAAAEGKVSSWAVRWLASTWLADMFTLYPSQSLVLHDGSDGSGTHCGVETFHDVPLSTRPIDVVEIDVVEDERMAQELAAWLQSLSTPQGSFKRHVQYWLGKHPDIHNFLRVAKRGLKDCIPPIAMRGIKKLLGKGPHSSGSTIWQGDYPDWQSAVAACNGGYDSEAIFQKVSDAARKVRDGEALWERDSVCFYHEEYNIPLLAWLMTVAAHHGGRLHVCDFGGALGSTYMQNKVFLDKIPHFSWSVVEQDHFVACGQKEFSTDSLDFYNTMAECFENQPINVVLFSSVLQYMPDPYALIQEAIDRKVEAIIVDRTPFLAREEKFTVQQVPEEIYHASYACRWVDRARLTQLLRTSYTIFPDYKSPVDPEGFYGFFALRKSCK